MSFVPTPNAGQSLGATRDQMRINTNVLRSTIAVDHLDVNEPNPGRHKWLRLVSQTASGAGGAPTTAANESLIYNRTSSKETVFRPPSTTAGTNVDCAVFPDTFGSATDFDRLAKNVAITNGKGGWTFLPGVLLFQYGSKTNAGSSGTITFPKAFTTEVYNIQLTLVKNGATSEVATVDTSAPGTTTTTFKYRTSASGTVDIYWTAIGF